MFAGAENIANDAVDKTCLWKALFKREKTFSEKRAKCRDQSW